MYRRWKFRHFPGPKPHWLIGSLPDLAAKGMHQQRDAWQKEYGPIFVWWLGTSPVVTIADPEEARKVRYHGVIKNSQPLSDAPPAHASMLPPCGRHCLSALEPPVMRMPEADGACACDGRWSSR